MAHAHLAHGFRSVRLRLRVVWLAPGSLLHSLTRVLVLGVLLSMFGCKPIPECDQTQGCGSGLVCQEGSCLAVCTASSDCAPGETCQGRYSSVGETWVKELACGPENECECPGTDTACVASETGLVCLDLAASCDLTACQAGFTCGSDVGSAACACSDGECGPRCSSEKDCQAGLACRKGQCEGTVCKHHDECRGDERCVYGSDGEGTCRLPGRVRTGDACTSSHSCQSGHCTRFGTGTTCQNACSADADCEGDERCAVDETYLNGDRGTCVGSQLCPPPQLPRLVDGAVECGNAQTCQDDSDCPSPAGCRLGLCTCPSGACAQSCEADAACDIGLTCVGGACSLPESCESVADCDSGFACSRSPERWSAGSHCRPNGPALVGERCTDSAECHSGLCWDGRCEAACQTSLDCDGLSCTQRSFADQDVLLCGPKDCGCEQDELCLQDGHCLRAPSCIDDACSDETVCVSGVCQRPCTQSADCSSDEECTWLPSESDFFCLNDPECQCASDEVCSSGLCIEAQPCVRDSECPDGYCVDRSCRQACSDNSECGDLECVLALVDGVARRLCGLGDCGCNNDAWCDPTQAPTRCFWGNECDDECVSPFACETLPNEAATPEGVMKAACACADALTCGKNCAADGDCEPLETCSGRGTCVPEPVCETGKDCGQAEDCVIVGNEFGSAPVDDATRGTCQAAQCQCTNEADVCLLLGSARYCVRRDQACSILDDECSDGYSCVSTVSRCACDDPSLCGGGCETSLDCDAARVCEAQRCVSRLCAEGCPADTVCGGPDGNHCVRPGPKAAYELCTSFAECASGYCFAGNTCAQPCRGSSECAPNEQCQLYRPDTFPGEVPVCLAEPSSCTGCLESQYCDNAELPSCWPAEAVVP